MSAGQKVDIDFDLDIIEKELPDLEFILPYALKDPIEYYNMDMDWTDLMARVEGVIRCEREGLLTEEQKERKKQLLLEMEKVKPIVERYHLAWYRDPPPRLEEGMVHLRSL